MIKRIIDLSGLPPEAVTDIGKITAAAEKRSIEEEAAKKELLRRAVEKFGPPLVLSEAQLHGLFSNEQNKEAAKKLMAEHGLPKPGEQHVLVEVNNKICLAYIGDDDFGVLIEDWQEALGTDN